MKRLLAALIALTVIFNLFSCNDESREYDESEVLFAAERLIRRSEDLNEIYWGRGIIYEENLSYSNGYYYPAAPEHLLELGFFTIEEMKEKTRETFSASYCENIFSTSLSFVGEDEIEGYARYYQGLETIMVYSKYLAFLKDEVLYDYDTLSVLKSKGEYVIVKISAEVKRGDKSQTREIEISLIEEKDGWKIDTPTYMSYQE